MLCAILAFLIVKRKRNLNSKKNDNDIPMENGTEYASITSVSGKSDIPFLIGLPSPTYVAKKKGSIMIDKGKFNLEISRNFHKHQTINDLYVEFRSYLIFFI